MSALVDMLAPVGPKAEAFVADQRFLTAIMGPFGSAKTTSCIRKIFESIGWQEPGPDGVRRARWCCVRDTYQQLETNVMNSWFTWFPKTKENWNGREMCHRLRWEIVRMDGSGSEIWELEMYFRAMGDQKAEQVLKGLELTGLWLNEVDTLDKSVLRFGIGRVGRYPSAKLGGCQWWGVICDFNAPDIDNWTYDLLVDENLPIDDDTMALLRETIGARFGIGFWRQPGGRSIDPPPENIDNLPPGYYQQMMIGMTPTDIRRFVDNEFGAVRNGQPVFPEFNDDFHVSKQPLKPIPGVPVCFGLDGGNTPAVIFGQKLDNGQIRRLSEVVIYAPGEDDLLEKLGPVAFGKLVREHWDEHYAHCKFGGAWGDPACWYGATEDFSWVREFEKASGFKLKPAPVKGNRLSERLELVRHGFVNNCGNQPGALISSACRRLRRGYASGYVIQRVQLSNGTGRWKDEPVKNDYSHPCDADQYLVAGLTRRGAAADVDKVRPLDRPRGGPKTKHGDGYFAHKRRA